MPIQIFFPRSIELEIERETSHNRGIFSTRGGRNLTFISQEQEMYGTYISGARGIPGEDDKDDEAMSLADSALGAPSAQFKLARPEIAFSNTPAPSPPPTSMYSGQFQPFKLEPNRRPPEDMYGPEGAVDVENGYQNLRSQTTAAGTGTALTHGNLERHNKRRPRMTQMSHFVQSFRSPIGTYSMRTLCRRSRLTLYSQISDVKCNNVHCILLVAHTRNLRLKWCMIACCVLFTLLLPWHT